MGMFDDLKCEYPLPDDGAPTDFQTKDFKCQMVTYRITAEGRLLRPIVRYEDVPEDERPLCKDKLPEERTDLDKFCGMIRSIVEREDDTQYHGWVNFYTSRESDGEWFEYNAKFTDGALVEIERVNRDQDQGETNA